MGDAPRSWNLRSARRKPSPPPTVATSHTSARGRGRALTVAQATPSAALEYKTTALAPAVGGSELLSADDETGVVEAIVSVTGIEDDVKDTVEPGAYADTLNRRKPKGVWSHDWNRWAARTEEIRELMPGDPALPKQTKAGEPWPAGAGALYVKARFNLNTDEGRNAFHNVRFFSETGECDWSIGYQVPPGRAVKTKNGGRRIRTVDLFEYGPVLFGAAGQTGTLSVKQNTPVLAGPAADVPPDAEPADDAGDDDAGSGLDEDEDALHSAGLAAVDWDEVDQAAEISPAIGGEPSAGTGPGGLTISKPALGRAQKTKPVTQTKDSGGKFSNTPWSNFSASDYTPEQYRRACLIDTGEGDADSKDRYKLPVREPGGAYNRNGIHAAAAALAGARGGLKGVSSEQRQRAAGALRRLYSQMGEDPPGGLQQKTAGVEVSDRPWADFTQADYTPAQWHDAALIHLHGEGEDPTSKGLCRLPVLEPGGALNRHAMDAAAQSLARGQLKVPEEKTAAAGEALRALYTRIGAAPQGGLEAKAAGQEVTPADVRATERLKAWYTHGGGAAQINWGAPGDFMRCVTIAGKHMTPGQAKGFCQLRHKDATGFYAGHAPTEQMPGKSLPAALALAAEVPAGAALMETKAPNQISGTLEEWRDKVHDAATAALAGPTGDDGSPRYLVVVNGTWADRVVASRVDLTGGDLTAYEAFEMPYDLADGEVTLGDPYPVTLQVSDPSGGGDAALSPLPGLIEHVAASIQRGLRLETKAGRVLSDANAKLLRGAVDQLLTVLQAAGIQLDVPGSDPAEETQETQDQGQGPSAEPLYLPDSTAPGAQVMSGKVLVDPQAVARSFELFAAAHDPGRIQVPAGVEEKAGMRGAALGMPDSSGKALHHGDPVEVHAGPHKGLRGTATRSAVKGTVMVVPHNGAPGGARPVKAEHLRLTAAAAG